MNKTDIEMALIQLGRAMKAIVEAYAPNSNHISITVVDGSIHVNACEWDGPGEDYITKDILDAHEFSDGTLRINGEYITPGVKIA